MNCKHCGKETENPKYCSRSCAAKETNKTPKRKLLDRVCSDCGTKIDRKDRFDRRTVCDECNRNVVDWTSITYGELTEKRSYQIHSRIRDLARRSYKKTGNKLECQVCGYNKHVVIHHIKPIGEHSNDTPIAEINDIENLMCLCPNHHWEIHNGVFYKGDMAR